MSPAASDDFNPTESASEPTGFFDPDPAGDEPHTLTPAASAPSESENGGISTLPMQADAELLPVVGLGGSAGSIAALQEFFDAMPADSGLAFVVVLHLSPDFESQLCPVLQAHTQMPVISVGERVRVEANHVYVIPPGQHLEMQDGHILLAPLENQFGKRVAVDLFFRTLAASQRSRAIAVVLSGLDSDGSIGIKRVKEHGGVTIAQDPDEAQHDGMPRSAIQTGMIDWVLPIAGLAPRLLQFWANEQRIQLPPSESPFPVPSALQTELQNPLNDADENALREILAFLLARTGHDFAHYKRATVLRRIGRRLQVNSLTNLPDYVAFLRTHAGEAGALLQDLLISVTNFFRDPEAFAALETHIPALFKGKKAGDQVRVWVAGCATGEEAYSVAMLLVEHASKLISPPAIQIFATDIDEEATRTAREGRYPQAIAADVSPERLRRFFLLDHGYYRVRTELREIVLFASHNILRDSPFSHLDLVTCRNLLIYFQPPAQEQVFSLFHFALKPDGILFLGGSEAREESEGLFAPLDKKHRIYGRRAGNRRPMHLANLPSPRAISLPDPIEAGRSIVARAASFALGQRGRAVPDFGELHLRLLEQFSPPSVLVTHNFDILHLSERAGRFMQFRGGAVSTNLLSVVHSSLRLELRAALMSAIQDGLSVDVPDLPLEIEGAARVVDLRVRPLRDEDNPGGAISYLMVVFDDRETVPADTILERSEDNAAVRRLERESGHLKTHLRSVVEQYEATTEELKASNEELQAMNEELRSAGEELETSKEELQAANEELITVNQEMKSKVEQLARSNGDLQNLMAATSIATIFLDRDLCIQRYTPPAVELFNLIPTDTFRPLSDLRHSLRYDSMIADGRAVIEKLQPIEREVSSDDNRWFLVRALPYRTVEDRIDGVVFTFVDVSRRHEAEMELRRSEERYRTLFTSIEEAFALCEIITDEAGKAVDYRLLEVNPAFEAATGISPAAASLKTARELVPGLEDWWVETYGRVALTGEAARFENYVATMDKWFEAFASPVGERKNGRFALIFSDITARKQQEEELLRLNAHIEQQARVFNTTLTGINDFAYLFDREGRFTYSNRPLLDLLDITLEEVIGKNFFDLGYPPELAARLQAQIESVFTQKVTVRDDAEFVSRAGATGYYEYIFNPILDESGEVQAVAGSTRDISARRNAEAALRESEERFRAMFEQANVGIAQTTLDGCLLAPNPGFCKIIGYSEEEAQRLCFRDITHPDDFEREDELTRQLVAGEISGYSVEKRYIRKDGSLIWGEMTATLMRDAAGKPIFMLSVVEDISERRAAQDAVRESRERLQVLLDSVQDYAILTTTPDNLIETWNPGAEKIFGWSEGEAVGQSAAMLFTPEDREKGEPEREIEIARREGRAADERWHLKKDGSRFFASGVMTALRDDPRHGFVKILRDLTAQKQAEEALRASESRFRTQADAVPQIIWTNDSIGAADGFNKRWFDYSGLTLEESLGLGWQRIVHPDDAFFSTQRWLSALKAGEIFEAEFRLRDRGGIYRWHITRNVPLHSDDQEVLGWFGTATDIQDLKDAQEALRQSRDSLEERVQERTQSLSERTLALQAEVVERQRLEDQTRQLMQRIVQVQEEERRRISRELHDNLGQHATAIMLSLQLLQDAEAAQPEGKRRQSATQLNKLHGQMDELISMTHRLAWELRPAILDNIGLEAALRQYLKEWSRAEISADFVSRLPNSDGAKAEIGLSPDAETALYRVVQEALTNVARHSAATMVSVVLERRADYVTAIVEDNGRGFDVEATSTSQRLGVRGMQERMDLVGGTLEVESQEGAGTTIYARVPLEAG